MKELYLKSLQMIKEYKIKNQKEYIELSKHYFLLTIESLKYISETRKFNKIIKIANNL